jgi:hypothetical protein
MRGAMYGARMMRSWSDFLDQIDGTAAGGPGLAPGHPPEGWVDSGRPPLGNAEL